MFGGLSDCAEFGSPPFMGAPSKIAKKSAPNPLTNPAKYDSFLSTMEGIDLKILRIRAGIKQYELAALVGCTPERLSEYESGRRRPRPERLKRIIELIERNSSNQSPDQEGG